MGNIFQDNILLNANEIVNLNSESIDETYKI